MRLISEIWDNMEPCNDIGDLIMNYQINVHVGRRTVSVDWYFYLRLENIRFLRCNDSNRLHNQQIV